MYGKTISADIPKSKLDVWRESPLTSDLVSGFENQERSLLDLQRNLEISGEFTYTPKMRDAMCAAFADLTNPAFTNMELFGMHDEKAILRSENTSIINKFAELIATHFRLNVINNGQEYMRRDQMSIIEHNKIKLLRWFKTNTNLVPYDSILAKKDMCVCKEKYNVQVSVRECTANAGIACFPSCEYCRQQMLGLDDSINRQEYLCVNDAVNETAMKLSICVPDVIAAMPRGMDRKSLFEQVDFLLRDRRC